MALKRVCVLSLARLSHCPVRYCLANAPAAVQYDLGDTVICDPA
jgi:hypothetical protein